MTLEEERDFWKQQYEDCEEDYDQIVRLIERRLDQLTTERDGLRDEVIRLKLEIHALKGGRF